MRARENLDLYFEMVKVVKSDPRLLRKGKSDLHGVDKRALAMLDPGSEFVWCVHPKGTVFKLLPEDGLEEKLIADTRRSIGTDCRAFVGKTGGGLQEILFDEDEKE